MPFLLADQMPRFDLPGAGDTMIVPAGTEHFVYTTDDDAGIIAAVPTGTVFIGPDGQRRVADWAI